MANDGQLVYVPEEVLEVRYKPFGAFLNITGQLADYVEASGQFPIWAINNNVVTFKDSADDDQNKLSAWASFRNGGFISLDAQTRNYFADKAISFWKVLEKNPHYKIPPIQRIGLRNRCFLKIGLPFEDIESSMFKALFAETAQKKMGGTRTDLQVTFNTKENGHDWRIQFGPMHENEGARHSRFGSSHYASTGMFFDIDIATTQITKASEVAAFIKNASTEGWSKIEKLAQLMGFEHGVSK